MERILTPNNSLLYLHCNDNMNSLKSVFLKEKVTAINTIVTKTTTTNKLVCKSVEGEVALIINQGVAKSSDIYLTLLIASL